MMTDKIHFSSDIETDSENSSAEPDAPRLVLRALVFGFGLRILRSLLLLSFHVSLA